MFFASIGAFVFLGAIFGFPFILPYTFITFFSYKKNRYLYNFLFSTLLFSIIFLIMPPLFQTGVLFQIIGILMILTISPIIWQKMEVK